MGFIASAAHIRHIFNEVVLWRGELPGTILKDLSNKHRPLSEDGPSVDQILENLQKRPSVKATLILARKDGSIIRASGAEFNIGSDSAVSTRQQEEPKVENSDPLAEAESDATQKEVKPTRLQTLAGCIFAHVSSAGALGEALQDSRSTGNAVAGNSDARSEREEQSRRTQHDDEVQLLRIRLRKQEVIIFPDPNYLCCVIQDTEKPGR